MFLNYLKQVRCLALGHSSHTLVMPGTGPKTPPLCAGAPLSLAAAGRSPSSCWESANEEEEEAKSTSR